METLAKTYAALFLIMLAACSMGSVDNRAIDSEPDLSAGTWRLILYGGANNSDPERVAVLEREADGLVISPEDPPFKFKVKEGLAGKDALKSGMDFISNHCAYDSHLVRAITLKDGRTAGYELVPVFGHSGCGSGNIVITSYSLRGEGSVNMRVSLMFQERDVEDGK